MDVNADPMLMEALLLLSSDDSDGDDNDNGDTRIDAAPRRTPVASGGTTRRAPRTGVGANATSRGTAKAISKATTTRRHATPSTPTPKRKRNRSSKCTYVARREEVARLRSLSLHLETQLQQVQQDHFRREQLARQHAMHERALLQQSQHENAQLRSLLAAGEARIQAMQSHHHANV